MKSYIIKLLIPLKNWLYFVFSTLGSFFLPLAPLVVLTTFLALFDWMSKMYCVYSVEGKDGIKSSKMASTFYKIILYGAFLATLYIVDVLFIKTLCYDLFKLFMQPDMAIWLTKVQLATVGTLMILAREAKSVDENWEQAFGYSPIDSVVSAFSWLKQFKFKNGTDTTKDPRS